MVRKKAVSILLVVLLVVLGIAPLGGCAQNSSKIPVVIDTDPGVDDLLAIVLAAGSEALDIRGITSVQGNVNGVRTAFNAQSIADYLGLECPVSKGALQPLERPAVDAAFVHASDGLGGVALPLPVREFDLRAAEDLIYDAALEAGGELVLVTLGPLTNVAAAFEKYPDLPGMLAGITMMGGSSGAGNTTTYGEFNIYNDPDAAKIVFDSGAPITMVGLNATKQAYFTADELRSMFDETSGLYDMLAQYADYMEFESYEKPGKTLHDLLAVAYLINPAVATSYKATVAVDVSSGDRRGQTVVGEDESGGVAIVDEVDQTALSEMMQKTLGSFEPSPTDAPPLAPSALFTQNDTKMLSVTEDLSVPEKDGRELTLKLICQNTESGVVYAVLEQRVSRANFDANSEMFNEHPELILHIDGEPYSLSSVGYVFNKADEQTYSQRFDYYSGNPTEYGIELTALPLIEGDLSVDINGDNFEIPKATAPAGSYMIEAGLPGSKTKVEMIPLDERGGYWISQSDRLAEDIEIRPDVNGMICVSESGKSDLNLMRRLSGFKEGCVTMFWEAELAPGSDPISRLEYTSFETTYSAIAILEELYVGQQIDVADIKIEIQAIKFDDAGKMVSFSYNPNTTVGRINHLSIYFPDGRIGYPTQEEAVVEVIEDDGLGFPDGQSYIYISINSYEFGYLDFSEAA